MQQGNVHPDRATQYKNLLNLLGDSRRDESDSGPSLKAGRMRSIINSHRLTEAYKEKAKVAYVSEQFPSEIVFSFGAIPWNVESMANMLAQSAQVDVNRIFRLTQERELSRDICSFLRGPFGMMLAGCYPRPDLVLTNNQPCEGLAKLELMSGKSYDVPVLALHTPHTIDEDSLTYLARQMDRIISQMEDRLGVELDPDALRTAIDYSNQARKYYCKALELLQTQRLPGVSRELHEIFGMNYFGVKENARLCKALYEEALELAEEEPRKKRVLWIGQVPEESHEVLRHMRQVVDVLYWAPLWEGNRMTLDEDRPFLSMAKRAILYHWSAERMSADILWVCENYEIEGFLVAYEWGCRNMMGVSPALRTLAKSRGLAYLALDIDMVDRSNNYSFNHIKNRVDAFLEILQ